MELSLIIKRRSYFYPIPEKNTANEIIRKLYIKHGSRTGYKTLTWYKMRTTDYTLVKTALIGSR